jgi:hypothetical protein
MSQPHGGWAAAATEKFSGALALFQELREAGSTYESIADFLDDADRSGAYRAVDRAARSHTRQGCCVQAKLKRRREADNPDSAPSQRGTPVSAGGSQANLSARLDVPHRGRTVGTLYEDPSSTQGSSRSASRGRRSWHPGPPDP